MYRHLSKELNAFAAPLILNNLFSVVMSTAMFAIIGNISPNAIIVTGIIDSLMYTLIGVLGVGTLSFNIYASRVRKDKPHEFKDYFKSILLLNGMIGVIFVLLIMFSATFFLREIYLFSGNLLMIGTWYAKIVSLKVFFNMLIFAMSNQVKVNKKTNDILKVGVISSIFQVLLAIYLVFFVFSGEEKILGIGISSTLSLLISVLAYLFILRKDIKELKLIKSSKKTFLLIKSVPLFGQELLEGSVMEFVLTIFLSRLGTLYAAYLVCLNVVTLCLTPMFMYCNAIVVMVGERLTNRETDELNLIPKLSLAWIVGIYSVASGLLYLFRPSILSIFSNDSLVIDLASSLLLFVVLVSLARPFFEVYKYCLQSLGHEKQVLRLTFLVNALTLLTLVSLYSFNLSNIYTLLLAVALNYLVLANWFRVIYNAELKKMRM
ncbi:matE family protein [Vagococcus sp. DIV0080]|uniref:Probable multidrug resistance protein NorM n=1 Tax=Candidatus Vagococcus giribetii TaxID=2230876 RepID=A0ABS3HP70_9ENTE|nr:MATE family efflux transporter [Vagococcus sp. DIV0080]MBO0475537.1 matE family protein [Vagococcus sp. DIV0080]